MLSDGWERSENKTGAKITRFNFHDLCTYYLGAWNSNRLLLSPAIILRRNGQYLPAQVYPTRGRRCIYRGLFRWHSYVRKLADWVSSDTSVNHIRFQWRIQRRPPLIFRPNWGPKSRKKSFLRPPPHYLRVWMTVPPLMWRSGSPTDIIRGILDNVVWRLTDSNVNIIRVII